MLQLFTTALRALQGPPDVFSREYLQWLRQLLDQSNTASALAALLEDVTGLSVLGNPTNTDADASAITAAADGQVLRRSGASVGFGTVATAGVADGAISMAKLADLAGLSIIGRGANSTGVPAAITGADGNVLRVAGTALGFGAIATAGITDAAVTYAKIQNVAGLSIVGRSASTSGVSAAITSGAADQVLRADGTNAAIGFGTIATGGIANNAVTLAKLATQAALSVLANATNGSAVPSAVAASNDGDVLRRSGTALGFGSIATAGITDAAVTMAKLANLAGLSVNGRSASTSGAPAAITGSTDQVLRVDSAGTTLGFGTIATGGIANNAVTLAKLATQAALSVLANATNSSAVPSAVAAATDGHILRRSGTALDFGKILTNFVTGSATNDNATAGDLGEFQEATAAAGSVTTWVAATPKNVTTLSLTAGDWDVDGTVLWSSGSNNTAAIICAIGTTTASVGSANDAGRAERTNFTLVSATKESVVCPTVRLSLASTTTVYLVGQISAVTGTPVAGGRLRARRVR